MRAIGTGPRALTPRSRRPRAGTRSCRSRSCCCRGRGRRAASGNTRRRRQSPRPGWTPARARSHLLHLGGPLQDDLFDVLDAPVLEAVLDIRHRVALEREVVRPRVDLRRPAHGLPVDEVHPDAVPEQPVRPRPENARGVSACTTPRGGGDGDGGGRTRSPQSRSSGAASPRGTPGRRGRRRWTPAPSCAGAGREPSGVSRPKPARRPGRRTPHLHARLTWLMLFSRSGPAQAGGRPPAATWPVLAGPTPSSASAAGTGAPGGAHGHGR